MELEKRKSREQKFTEFYECIQLEYIVAELRYNIYPDGPRRDKSLEIMEAKKGRIIDMAIRNRSKVIFEGVKLGFQDLYSEKLRNDLYERVVGRGVPDFMYRDSYQREKLTKYDLVNYFKYGKEFDAGILGSGTLISADFEKNNCVIRIDGKNNCVDIQIVKRIFEK